MGRGRKGITEQSQRKPKRGETTIVFVKNRETKKKCQYLNMSLTSWRTWIHNSLSIYFCQTDKLKHRVVIKYSVCKFRFVYVWRGKNISCITSYCVFIFFRLFHRLDNFICYISDIFLPSRQWKFGNTMPNCVYQHNHFIFSWFIQNTHAFTKMPHMSGKVRFMQYKYPISTNKQLATVWWCSWRWGWPPLNP